MRRLTKQKPARVSTLISKEFSVFMVIFTERPKSFITERAISAFSCGYSIMVVASLELIICKIFAFVAYLQSSFNCTLLLGQQVDVWFGSTNSFPLKALQYSSPRTLPCLQTGGKNHSILYKWKQNWVILYVRVPILWAYSMFPTRKSGKVLLIRYYLG